MWLQILTSAMNRAQVGKWYSPGNAKDRTKTLFVVYSWIFAARIFPALSGGQRARNIPGPCRLLRVPCVMRPAVQHSLPQAVGFRCAHCTSEFDTRHAMDCHRRKQSPLGTGCANPSNSKSVSFTGRASISSSIVREHELLGAHANHTQTVRVHRQLLPLKIQL